MRAGAGTVGVSAGGLAKVLFGGDEAEGAELFAALAAEAEAAESEAPALRKAAGEAAGDEATIAFQELLVALHRKRPREALDAGWLTDFGAKKRAEAPLAASGGSMA